MPDWLNIIVRSLAALTILFVLTRILGKKQISQLTFFEYVLGITLGDLVGMISTDINANYVHGLLAIAVWFTIPFTLEILALKSKRLREWFDGKGTVVVRKGKILEKNLKKERYSGDELLEQLRTKNVFNLADVEFAILETSGDLSVMLKSEKQTLTPEHIGMKMTKARWPEAVIMDGKTDESDLADIKKSEEWLRTELDKLDLTQDQVFLGQVNEEGRLYVDLYDDKAQAPTHLKKQSSIQAENREADHYLQLIADLKRIVHELETNHKS